MRFEDDAEKAAFVLWAEQCDCGVHEAVQREVAVAESELLAAGWTRHGYLDDTFVPPGHFYDRSWGVCDADDPLVIAGRWVCLCGFETDRLAYADGHMEAAREGRKLHRPGPHEVTEIERTGPAHREWGETLSV